MAFSRDNLLGKLVTGESGNSLVGKPILPILSLLFPRKYELDYSRQSTRALHILSTPEFASKTRILH